ncbi:MAG: alanine--tRNA ligase [Sedimentisphaerales bacterium]|nr:alanine--tRNA ligase [Sedimentisphaerales bacterium]
MFSSKEIRSRFIDFFKERAHAFVPSAPVVPIGDETLLFTNAGMNQFKDYFLGLKQAPWKRAANSQKCIRVSGKHNDLEEVGLDTYHHTFFEMLGNWSFDDYFKAEAIAWAWELLTGVYGIGPDRLWATVFAGDPQDGSQPDQEARELWEKVTALPADRILACGRKDNFWEMGATGPCGPCSEIHIDLGPDRCDRRNEPGHRCAVNAGCARYIELWNLVFIQFNRKPDGSLERLEANYVDTGAGLERISAVLQNKTSNYDTDLFMPVIQAISELTGHKYTSELGNKTDNAFRVIADHIRSLTFSIADGVTPSNEGRGYVMRRILRRAARFGRVLDAHEPFLYKLVPVLAAEMGEAFPEIRQRADFIATVIESEEAGFGRTLDRGLEIFSVAVERAQKAGGNQIDGEDAFRLYDTYGFPLDLTQLLARERGFGVDVVLFEKLMDQQRRQARAAQKTGTLKASLSGVELPTTEDSLKYQTDTCKAHVAGWIISNGFFQSGYCSALDADMGLVLDRTCFYAEAGGQVGDVGMITGPDFQFVVEGTEKIADCVVHTGKLLQGAIRIGMEITATVDKNRQASKKNHTATHLLQWALQQVLGDAVHQQGSLVCPDYLRFDFTCPRALTPEEIGKVEQLVRDTIARAEPVACAVMPIEEARHVGAMALFGEKYGDQVRVIAVGAEDESHVKDAFSREFCGGTHVDNTAEIGGFKIVKEESISAGVRRITALTGQGLLDYLLVRGNVVDELAALLKTPAEQVLGRVQKLLEDNRKLTRDLKTAAQQGGSDAMSEAAGLFESAGKIGNTAIVVGRLCACPVEQARQAMDMVKKKGKSAVVVFGMAEADDKAMLLVGVTDDLVAKGLTAGDIVRTVAPIIGGGGGGRPQMAQAGGKDPKKLDDALQKAREIIEVKLTKSG